MNYPESRICSGVAGCALRPDSRHLDAETFGFRCFRHGHDCVLRSPLEYMWTDESTMRGTYISPKMGKKPIPNKVSSFEEIYTYRCIQFAQWRLLHVVCLSGFLGCNEERAKGQSRTMWTKKDRYGLSMRKSGRTECVARCKDGHAEGQWPTSRP